MSTYEAHATNCELIASLLEAWQAQEANSMAALYSEGFVLSTPLVGTLYNEEAQHYWHWWFEQLAEWDAVYGEVKASTVFGRVPWRVELVTSQKAQKVTLEGYWAFDFFHGKIKRHQEVFSLPQWWRQTKGWYGYILPFYPLAKPHLQTKNRIRLKRFTKGKT